MSENGSVGGDENGGLPSRYPTEFTDLRPSAQLLYLLIARHGPITQPELREITHLSEWTVRKSTKELESLGLIDRKRAQRKPQTVMCTSIDSCEP